MIYDRRIEWIEAFQQKLTSFGPCTYMANLPEKGIEPVFPYLKFYIPSVEIEFFLGEGVLGAQIKCDQDYRKSDRYALLETFLNENLPVFMKDTKTYAIHKKTEEAWKKLLSNYAESRDYLWQGFSGPSGKIQARAATWFIKFPFRLTIVQVPHVLDGAKIRDVIKDLRSYAAEYDLVRRDFASFCPEAKHIIEMQWQLEEVD